MSVAKVTQAKGKGRSRATAKLRRRAINRRNAQKSTGPRTPEGKESSKFNAVTHGLTARSALLPGDDPVALAEMRRELLEQLQPRSAIETMLIADIAEDQWINDRSRKSAQLRVTSRIRHEPLEQAAKEKDDALELGEHLYWGLARPLAFDAQTLQASLGEPPLPEKAVHPSRPARVRLRLEQTIAGCDWLFGEWDQLGRRLNVEDLWLPSDAFKMVRLLGKHAINMDQDLDVARLLMCSISVIHANKDAATGDPKDPFSDNLPVALVRLLAAFEFENREYHINQALDKSGSFLWRLRQLPLARIAPTDGAEAKEWLATAINGEIKRLGGIRATLQEISDADAAEAPDRCWFETGPEGENHRRYILSNKRVLNRSISIFLSARKQAEAGSFDLIEIDQPCPVDRDESPADEVGSVVNGSGLVSATDEVADTADTGGVIASENGAPRPDDDTQTTASEVKIDDLMDQEHGDQCVEQQAFDEVTVRRSGAATSDDDTQTTVSEVKIDDPMNQDQADQSVGQQAPDEVPPIVDVERLSPPVDDARPAAAGPESLAVTLEMTESNGDVKILRNEAKPDHETMERGTASVSVQPEIGASALGNEPMSAGGEMVVSEPRTVDTQVIEAKPTTAAEAKVDDRVPSREEAVALRQARWEKEIEGLSPAQLRERRLATARVIFAQRRREGEMHGGTPGVAAGNGGS